MVDWVPILLMLIIAVGFALVSLGVSYLMSVESFQKKNPHNDFPLSFTWSLCYILFSILKLFFYSHGQQDLMSLVGTVFL